MFIFVTKRYNYKKTDYNEIFILVLLSIPIGACEQSQFVRAGCLLMYY